MASDITENKFFNALKSREPKLEVNGRTLPQHDPGAKQFQRLLRNYVDQWIDTGVFENGTEALDERGRLHDRWFKNGRLLPYALKKRDALDTVYSVVLEVLGHKPQMVLSDEGLQIVFPTSEPKIGEMQLDELAEREAKRFFVWFLASDLRVKLGKCRVCQLYSKKSRTFYKNGTHCRRCKSNTSATAIMKKKREDLQRRKEEALAAVLMSDNRLIDRDNVKARKSLADKVNRRVQDGKITSNWVKRHLPRKFILEMTPD